MKEPDPTSPQPGHTIILRHQDGDAWDYAAIEHLGTKATVEIPANAMTSTQRALMSRHDDTFVSGPAWAEFTKELGIDSDASKTAGSVYVFPSIVRLPVIVMTWENAERTSESRDRHVLRRCSDDASGRRRLELSERDCYDSWEKFGTNEKNSVAQTNKKEGGWFQLREHVSFHNDTLTDQSFRNSEGWIVVAGIGDPGSQMVARGGRDHRSRRQTPRLKIAAALSLTGVDDPGDNVTSSGAPNDCA